MLGMAVAWFLPRWWGSRAVAWWPSSSQWTGPLSPPTPHPWTLTSRWPARSCPAWNEGAHLLW